MSLINIINESFDRQNKGILSEGYTKSSKAEVAKNKSLHEYFDYEDAADFDELDDMLEESGSLIHEAAEKLGFKDFEWEDSVQGPYGKSDFWITDDDGNKLHATVDFSETLVTDIDEAVDLLDSLDWKVVGDNIYENIFIKKQKRKSQKLKEAVEKYNNLDAIVISTDLADEVFKELRRKHIKPLAFYANDSDLFIFVDTTKKLNSADTLKQDNYEGISMDYGFEDDIDQLEALENTDEWINKLKEWCYLKPWQGVVYNYDGDISYNLETLLRESVKSKKLKEAVEKVYKYIVVNHSSPEDFYLIKSNHPVDENIFDAWNFLDVTDKHGKGTVIWNDEYIDFNESGDKSIADLDDEYRKEMVRYLSDLEKKGDLDKIKDDYLALDELQYQGYLTDFPVWIDPGDGDGVLEDYMNDKTLKNSYLATMYSDYLESSYVDNDSSSAAVYIDIDDLTQYTDYEEFFGEDEDDF